MDLQSVKRSLREELGKSESQELFETARMRNEALANHSTAFSVLTALEDRLATDHNEREALTRCLIKEQQRAHSPLWSTILIVAYFPMLKRLRSRVAGNPLPPDDLDQAVVTTFLEVVQGFPLLKWPNYTSVRLRQQTQRRVFRELNRQRLSPDFWDFRSLDDIPDDEIDDRPIWDLARPGRRNSRDVEETIALLLDYVNDGIDPDKLDVVVMTTVKGQSLRDFIQQCHVGSSDSPSEREYQRAKRERTRTLAKIRRILAKKMSPNALEEAL